MNAIEFKLPDIGEGVHEGEIVEWFVNAGDEVREDAPMVEVMTDKATVTIGAPCQGKIERVLVKAGEKAKVGQILVVLAPAEKSSSPAKRDARPSGPPASAVGDIASLLPGTKFFSDDHGEHESAAHKSVDSKNKEFFNEKPLATPATRALAKEFDVDLRKIPPTGDGGRVTANDVRQYAARHTDFDELAPASAAQSEERKPFIGVRRKIAEHMTLAKTAAAHFTFVEQCDVGRLMELRDRLAPEAERRGILLSYLPFIVKAVVHALKAHPVLNSSLDEAAQEIVYKREFHIGIATATDAGLMVPVVRNADALKLFELAREIDRLSSAARSGRIEPRDLKGSTFTITSLGKQGGLLATPILNHPEVGILGVHRIRECPVVRDGKIEIGQLMNLSLSFDHRIVDGHIGAAFAYSVIDFLENPEQMFFEYL